MTTSERVARMMKNFIIEWQDDKNIAEIAEKYRLTPATVYVRLQEIADGSGYKREDLLKRPHKSHKKKGRSEQPKNLPEFSSDEVLESFDELINQTRLVMNNIEECLSLK